MELDDKSSKAEFTTEIKENIDDSAVSLSLEKESNTIKQQSDNFTVVISYENKPKKFEVKDFANFFVSRFKFLEGILRNRRELQNTLTIRRISDKKEREKVSAIGIIEEISETRNGNIILTLEDLTGRIKVLVSKNNKELFLEAKDLVPDEIIGVHGSCGDKIIFSEKIIWPDIPVGNQLKKGPNEEYVIFLSDIHVGSNLFLKDSKI